MKAALESTSIDDFSRETEAELLQATLETMRSGVVMLDGDGIILTCNTRFFEMALQSGLLENGFAGQDYSQYKNTSIFEIMPALADKPQEVQGVGGRVFELLYRDSKVREGSTLVLFRDVTQERLANVTLQSSIEETEKLQHARAVFVSQIAHHFRTPLNVILGYVDILETQAGEIDTMTQASYLEFIKESASALLLNMNEMMDIIRLQRHDQQAEMEQRKLEALFSGAVHEIEQTLESEGVKLDLKSFYTQIENCAVTIDPRLAKRALMSLLRITTVIAGPGSVIRITADRTITDRVMCAIEFPANRVDAASVLESIANEEPVSEISLSANTSSYGFVLASLLFKLCQADFKLEHTGDSKMTAMIAFKAE